jgi:type I restriction enzyme, S subunit
MSTKTSHFKNTEIGLIPEDWEVKAIKAISPLQRGFDLPTRHIRHGDFPVVYSNGIVNYHSGYMVKGPGIVTGRSGTIGKVTFVKENFWPHNTALWVTNFFGNNPKYIYYLFKSIQFERFSSGSGVPTLNRNDIHDFLIPLPPLPEQTAIAAALSDMDALIAQTEKLLQKKKAIKQGVMQELLTGRKRLQGFAQSHAYKNTALGLIPEDWEVKSLQEFGVFSKGAGIRKDQANSGDIPCVRYGEIYTRHNDFIKHFHSFISKEVANTAVRLKQGDILFAGSGETKAEIGKTVAFIDHFEAYAGGDIVIWSPQHANSLFLGFLLNVPLVQNQKAQRGQGDAVVHISSSHLKSILIPLPPLPEQTAIAQAISAMDEAIAAIETKLHKLRQQKQGMMQVLLTGQIRLV